MTNERLMFNVENVSVHVIVGDGKKVVCTKHGDVLLNGKNRATLLLQQVLYTPRFHKNIFCVGALVKKDVYDTDNRTKPQVDTQECAGSYLFPEQDEWSSILLSRNKGSWWSAPRSYDDFYGHKQGRQYDTRRQACYIPQPQS